MALLKLADTYTKERLERACALALTYTARPSYKSIQTILKAGQDLLPEQTSVSPQDNGGDGFTRGADYYRDGGRDDC